ncbi:hypothetical protein L6R50_27940 [Myxococcota bacterium]|nr:hypothetical protein [Myxococcota bacterium]
MRYWTGSGVFQWEHTRQWQLPISSSEFTRAEGALLLPGGFSSLSAFFRRQSQSGDGPVTLRLWTTPVFFKPLDEAITATTAPQYLFELSYEDGQSISMDTQTTSGARVFAARIGASQPMGSLLFWEMRNTDDTAVATVVGDLYLVANHAGVLSLPRIGRMVESGDAGPTAGGRVPVGGVGRP